MALFDKTTEQIMNVFTTVLEQLKERGEYLGIRIGEKFREIERIQAEKEEFETEQQKNIKYIKKLEKFFDD